MSAFYSRRLWQRYRIQINVRFENIVVYKVRLTNTVIHVRLYALYRDMRALNRFAPQCR